MDLMMGMFEGKMTIGIPLISNQAYLERPRWPRWTWYLAIAVIGVYVSDKLDEIGA